MPTEANPHHFSKHTKDDVAISQIEDAVDFPHTGLIKALSLGMVGNYAILDSATGFDITQSSSSSSAVVVEAGKIFRNGILSAATVQTTFAQSDFNATVNAHHLLVVSGTNAVVIRKFGTGGIYGGASNVINKIPPYSDKDTIIAIISFTTDGFNDMKVQYLTTAKSSNGVSIGYNNSGYDQTLSIVGGAGKTQLISEENVVEVKLNGTTSSNTFQVTDDAGQTQFAVKGDGTLTTDLTANRVLISDTNKNIAASSVIGQELALLSGAAFGVSTNNILRANANLADDDFLRVDGTQIEGRTAAQTLTDIAAMPLAGGTFTGNVIVDADLKVTNNIFQQHRNMTNNLAVGWHTIAHIKGRSGGSASGTAGSAQRGIAQIIIKEESSGKHALYEFKVNHLFGTGNAIQLENSAFFAAKIIQQVRMKENSTYDGAVFQIYVSDATNNLQVFITDNFADHGWTVNDAVADADNSGHDSLGLGYNNAYSTFSATRTYNLDTLDVVDGGTIMGGNAFVQGNLQINTGKTFRSRRLPTISLTASTTLVEGTHAGTYIFVTGSSIVITIPDNQGAGVHFTIINNDGNGFTLRTGAGSSAGDNMNGAQTDIAVAARNGVTCISTGTDYVVLGV